MPSPITQLLSAVGGSTEADAALLARFQETRDEVAFAELVRRHGPLVYGVCRRALGDGPDAEDAFQACFLVLARRIDKAMSVSNLSGWLYRVACLTAQKARCRRAKRRSAETTLATLHDVAAPLPERNLELGRVIDEELALLPERYRTVVVLCELRELTLDEAAAELNCPRGTVASRLSRGRGILGKRLLRRGLLAVGLSGSVTSARVSAALLCRTVEAVFGTANKVAISLSQEVLEAMSGTKLKLLSMSGLIVLTVVLGGFSQRSTETHAAPIPEVKARALTAELDRVRLDKIGAALACPTIREQLKITAEQDKKLEAAWNDASSDFKDSMKRIQALGAAQLPTPASVLDVFNGMDDTVRVFDEKAMAILTPDQLRRLRQIQLQREGALALLSRHAIRVLKLTPEQEDQIAGEVSKIRGTGVSLMNSELQAAQGAIGQQEQAILNEIRQKQAEDAEKILKAAMKHLTAEQKTAWAELTGAAIPTTELLRARSPFTDPKFAGLMLTEAQQQFVQPQPVQPPPPPVQKK